MSIVLIDGFDAYSDADRDLNRKPRYYATGSIGSHTDTPWGTGRSIGFGEVAIASTTAQLYTFMPYNSGVSPPVTWGKEITVGFAYKYTDQVSGNDPDTPMLTIGEFVWPQTYNALIRVYHTTDGSFTVECANDGGSPNPLYLFTMPPGSFDYNSWDYWEFSVVIDSSSGKLRIDRNGERICDLSNIQTQPVTVIDGGNIAWIYFSGTEKATFEADFRFYDDLYVGDEFTDILGPQKVITLRPNGDIHPSPSNKWIPSAETSPPGSPPVENYEMVDDTTLDNDTTYVYTDVVDAEDMYTLEDLPTDARVVSAVQQTLFARKDDTEVHSIAPLLETGGTKVEEAEVYLPPYYRGATGQVYTLNPDTGLAWTVSDINALKIGHKLKK